jgi:serine O-acetyltransferase
MASAGKNATQLMVRLQRAAHGLEQNALGRPVARLIEMLIRLVWSAYLPAGAEIAASAHFEHKGLAVVINRLSVIGPDCRIGPHVVLGGRAPTKGAPRLGRSVIVHAGAKLVGPITIGDNCVIGANAVVTRDLPANCVAVGVPARVVKEDIDIKDYWG